MCVCLTHIWCNSNYNERSLVIHGTTILASHHLVNQLTYIQWGNAHIITMIINIINNMPYQWGQPLTTNPSVAPRSYEGNTSINLWMRASEIQMIQNEFQQKNKKMDTIVSLHQWYNDQSILTLEVTCVLLDNLAIFF